MTTVLELGAVADGSDHRRGGLGTDALDLGDPLAGFVFAEDLVDLLVEGSAPPIGIAKEIVKFGDRLPRHGGQLVVLISQYVGDHPARSGNALGEGGTTIQQQAANLADDGGAVIDYPLPGAMQGLDVLLLDALLGDEGDMRLAGGRADRLRIVAIVLLPPHKGLHILRADYFDLMPKRFELPRPVERARARFQDDRTAIDPRHRRKKFVAHHPASQNDMTIATDEMDKRFFVTSQIAETSHKFVLWFDRAAGVLPSRPAISRLPRAGAVKAGRVLRGHRGAWP